MKKQILCALAIAVGIPGAFSQSLSEKEYDLSSYSDQLFTTAEFINDGVLEGHILVSSDRGSSNDPKTIIQRVDNEGVQVWSAEYDPPGNTSFDRDLLVKNKRAGFNPSNGYIIVTGQINDGTGLRPAWIELDPNTGVIQNEYHFKNYAPQPHGLIWGDGYINAINTVESGTYVGAYMVGEMEVPGKDGDRKFVPLVMKRGGTGDFEFIYETDVFAGRWTYLDVDVDEYEGNIVCVGFAGSSHQYPNTGGSMIIDVFDQSGNLQYKHSYRSTNCRLTSVKSTSPGYAIVGGTIYGQFAIVMEINIYTGDIVWQREISIGDYKDGSPGPFTTSGEVIEIELDNEGMPIFMTVESPHFGPGREPVGPGIFGRLDNNGAPVYAFVETMDLGYGDLEPQLQKTGNFADLDFIASLTGESRSNSTSKLNFHKSDDYTSRCNEEIEFDTPESFDPVVNQSGTAKIKSPIVRFDNTDIDYQDIVVNQTEGCCWLPYFNPLPWNHPWQTTYWDHGPAVINAGGSFSQYNWDVLYAENVYTGDDITSIDPHSTSGSNNEIITIPFRTQGTEPGLGYKSAQRNLVEITVVDDNDCEGWDATYVQIAEDGMHNRPDYSDPDNDDQYPNYGHCNQTATSPFRYMYEHYGWYLSSGGFGGLSGPANKLNDPFGVNFLAATYIPGTIHTFNETVNDAFQASPTRVNTVATDVEILPCNCGNSATSGLIEYEDDGRTFYSLSDRNLPIVKYSYALEMIDPMATLLDNHKLVKRRFIRQRSSGSGIDPKDYLIPVLDDRYTDNYPLTGTSQTLYLDIWYMDPSGTTYPYTICDHERIPLTTVLPREIGPDNKKNNSASSSQKQDNVKTSIKDVYTDFALYPNPSNGLFNVNGLPENTTISVVNIRGSIINHFITSESSEYGFEIDLTGQTEGMYFLEIRTQSGDLFVEKMVVE